MGCKLEEVREKSEGQREETGLRKQQKLSKVWNYYYYCYFKLKKMKTLCSVFQTQNSLPQWHNTDALTSQQKAFKPNPNQTLRNDIFLHKDLSP